MGAVGEDVAEDGMGAVREKEVTFGEGEVTITFLTQFDTNVFTELPRI